MVAYQEFVALSRSPNSDERGQAAHLAAEAYIYHGGPADERAALHTALIGFLDDPSVRVRAALAYGLLHAPQAPRPILLALLHDSAVIARAVAQYSPVLIDSDLVKVADQGDSDMLHALALRAHLGPRLAETLLACGVRSVVLSVLKRSDIALSAAAAVRLAGAEGRSDADIRGEMLARGDLPALARLVLVEASVAALAGARLVKGALAVGRLRRLLRDASDTAAAEIGEIAAGAGEGAFAAEIVARERLSVRTLLHAAINGHTLFFADCLTALTEMPRAKVLSLIERGGRPALNALLARCGFSVALRNLIARVILHTRAANLVDDAAARHFVVTALAEDMIAEHDGDIPAELSEAFGYLSEQSLLLARAAARGGRAGFARRAADRALPAPEGSRLQLPAA